MKSADQIVRLIPHQVDDTAMWRGQAAALLEQQVRQLVDIKAVGRVYRRDLPATEAHARAFAALMGRLISKGAYRRKEKRITRRHPIA